MCKGLQFVSYRAPPILQAVPLSPSSDFKSIYSKLLKIKCLLASLWSLLWLAAWHWQPRDFITILYSHNISCGQNKVAIDILKLYILCPLFQIDSCLWCLLSYNNDLFHYFTPKECGSALREDHMDWWSRTIWNNNQTYCHAHDPPPVPSLHRTEPAAGLSLSLELTV